ncbi:unnamed protein product [Mytilus coruscus]|uniref:Uncharacterized protein n=1 Tax=Mytilus coruscus TaxID=42192 RepID=A0A6J8A9N4_MYTCO|nr:unnamed protein product [Mytilus coruscus]
MNCLIYIIARTIQNGDKVRKTSVAMSTQQAVTQRNTGTVKARTIKNGDKVRKTSVAMSTQQADTQRNTGTVKARTIKNGDKVRKTSVAMSTQQADTQRNTGTVKARTIQNGDKVRKTSVAMSTQQAVTQRNTGTVKACTINNENKVRKTSVAMSTQQVNTQKNIGTIKEVSPNDVKVEFPQNDYCKGVIEEMKIVPNTHRGVGEHSISSEQISAGAHHPENAKGSELEVTFQRQLLPMPASTLDAISKDRAVAQPKMFDVAQLTIAAQFLSLKPSIRLTVLKADMKPLRTHLSTVSTPDCDENLILHKAAGILLTEVTSALISFLPYDKPKERMESIRHEDSYEKITSCDARSAETSDIAWVFLRLLSRQTVEFQIGNHLPTGDTQMIPFWTGYHRKTSVYCRSFSIVSYAPIVNSKPSDMATVYTTMKRVPHQSLIIRLVGFHTVACFIASIGKLWGDGGLPVLLVDSGVYAACTVEQMLSGKQFNRAVRALTLTYEAMMSL